MVDRTLCGISRILGSVVVIACLAILAGCGRTTPSVEKPRSDACQPVKGRVLHADGKPLTSGKVYFSYSNPAFAAVGDVKTDGSFAMTTFKSGLPKDGSADKGEPGVPDGEYFVRIVNASGVSYNLTDTSAKVVVGDNDLTFKVKE